MAILKKTYPLLLPLLLSGCYEDFDPKIDTKPVLCLNSLIKAGYPIDVNVSRTWLYTDLNGEKDHSVADATIIIFANGNPVSEEFIPQEGDRIMIKAFSPTYGEAEAEVTVPVAPAITDTDFTTNLTEVAVDTIPGWGMYADVRFDIRITMTFEDYDDTDEYHRLDYFSFNPSGNYGVEEEEDNIPSIGPLTTKSLFSEYFHFGSFEAIDPVFYEFTDPFEDVMYGSYYNMFFSDRLYKGGTKSLTFGFSKCVFEMSGWDMDPADLECGWKVTLFSISESYYNWYAYTLQSDGFVSGDFGEAGLSEPIWGYSNVSTGAGVVAAQSNTTVTIDIKDFLSKAISDAIAGQ